MKIFNKNLLIITIILLADLNTYTITPEPIIAALESAMNSISTSTSSSSSISTFDVTPYNFSAETATEKLTLQTFTHEDKITLEANYHNKETGEIAHAEQQLYPDNSLDNQNRIECDVSLSSNNSDISHTSNESNNTSQEHESDILHDLLNDSACDTRRQEMNENNTTQTHNTIKQSKVIREKDLQKNRVYFHSDFGGIPLDSDLILKKQNVFHDPRSTLSSPVIEARFDRLATFYRYKANLNSKFQSELAFCEALRSGKVLDLFNQLYSPHLPTAQAAFDELKKLWIRERKHMFLVHNSYNNRELDFITKLGIDIIIKAERALVTRPDYIVEHADTQSLKIIQEYKEHCIQLQQKGDRAALLNEIKKLRPTVKKRSHFATKISFAIAQKTFFDPATTALHEIAHAPSLEKACRYVKNLELQLLTQAQQQNIMNESQMRTWITKHYGFDLLDAAQNCYKSRTDYVYTPNNQSYLSDAIQPLLNNIESKSLPKAHAELVHLEQQIDKVLAEHNITDPLAQKEYIKKSLGRDVLEIAHKTYEARSDHKALVESFMAIDINQAAATILENNNTYESVANEMSDLAKHVFANAHHCNMSFLPKIESHVYDSIDAMRIAQDHPTFIFNFSMVSHTLGDIQQIAHAILSGRHPVLERSSELLIRGFGKFFKGLDPFKQASNMGHLASDLGSLLKKGGTALWNDPIATTHNGITSVFTLTELIRNTADFTSDLTIGKLYLSPEEYKQRTDAFCAMMEPLQGITAEQCTDFVAQVAADVVFFKGLGNAYNFLKEIDVLGKLGESAAAVARTFKKEFDTHLANNPILVTAEGIPVKMTEAVQNMNKGGGGKNVINSAKTLLESEKTGLLSSFKEELDALKTAFGTHRYGFAESKYQKAQLPYEHIFTLEGLGWSKKGRVSGVGGFHHDLRGAVKNSGAVQFIERGVEKNGCYLADLVIDGSRIPNKTFFPQHWSREEVVRKIGEAYDNFITSGAIAKRESGGKYIISGFTSEGIEVEMYITKNGQITTAYPIVEARI